MPPPDRLFNRIPRHRPKEGPATAAVLAKSRCMPVYLVAAGGKFDNISRGPLSFPITMHHLRSRYALVAFRLGALGLLLFVLNVATTIALGTVGIIANLHEVLHTTLWLLTGIPVTGILYAAVAPRARCPLCLNPPLVARGCEKHRRCKTLFGSYRLRVAITTTLAGRFTCPYCGEETRCLVRRRNSGRDVLESGSVR